MWKPITKNVHGVIDYAYTIVVPLMPEIAGFKKATPARNLCRLLGAGAISYTLITRAKWGIYPLISFRKHLLLDVTVSVIAIATPWLFSFSKTVIPRNTLICIGVAGLGAALLTDPFERDEQDNRYLFI